MTESSVSPLDIDPHHGQQLACHGYTVLLTNPDGTITGGRQGLFDHDTRVLSRYQCFLDGALPDVDSSGLVDPGHWTGRLTVARPGGTAKGPQLPQDALELTIDRRVGLGMIEELTVDNHSAVAATTCLTIFVDADFRDVIAVGSADPIPGRVTRSWDAESGTLAFNYDAASRNRTLRRAISIRVLRADSLPRSCDEGIAFEIHLAPHGSWRAALVYEVLVDGRWRTPVEGASSLAERARAASAWQRERTHIESDPAAFGVILERAAEDLSMLRNWEHDTAVDAWVPNAGLPAYTGFFGRDALTAGWQAALLGPELLRGAIAGLAASQSQSDSAWHDAEPGKMIHEMRRGPLSELDVIPQRGYYGTQTSSSFFVVTLTELWHWTGDISCLQTYVDAALRTLQWADRFGDRDGDGFLEYDRRSERGLKNHGWKDSDEAIRYPDGSLVDNPIATIEEQAFHWLALQRIAEILLALGDEARSAEFLGRARELRGRWHQAFWMPEERFYAVALDSGKNQVQSVGSNPGHALAVGCVPVEHAREVADRLMAADLFSGWGIRTLAATHPSYNPLAYHLGTVWPVENATFVLGFKRYGLDAHVERLATATFDAAERFRGRRLPEALGGHARQTAMIPTVYPASNSPQAWSASATIQMAQTLLGIYPFAPARLLALVRPTLPPWLNTVIVRNLRVGDARVSLRFERSSGGRTSYDILDKSGPLHVLHVPPPQDIASERSWRDVVTAFLLDHAPGRTAAALRIALGDDA